MDAFFASIEQHDAPELSGKPVLVGGTGRRGVVSAASYEARPSGARSAMPMEEARRRCPEAVVLSPRFERYKEVSEDIMNVFSDFSPLVEPLSLDEAFLDMTGSEEVFGPPEQMARALKDRVVEATDGLTVSVGVSSAKFVAKVASDFQKPDGLTIVPAEDVLSFLWPLPISRLWGVGPKTKIKLERLGLKTIEDVARRPEAELRANLGSLGSHVYDLAWGRDERQVTPHRDRKSVGTEYTLEEDVVGKDEILPHLRRAADEVAAALRRKSLLAQGVRVKLKTDRFKLHTRQAKLPTPTDSAPDLLEGARSLLDHFDLSKPMRLVGIAAFELAGSDAMVQQDLFGRPKKQRRRKLDQALDTLKSKFGRDAVRRGSDLE
jgi:DNA polymerase-4